MNCICASTLHALIHRLPFFRSLQTPKKKKEKKEDGFFSLCKPIQSQRTNKVFFPFPVLCFLCFLWFIGEKKGHSLRFFHFGLFGSFWRRGKRKERRERTEVSLSPSRHGLPLYDSRHTNINIRHPFCPTTFFHLPLSPSSVPILPPFLCLPGSSFLGYSFLGYSFLPTKANLDFVPFLSIHIPHHTNTNTYAQ